MGIALLTYGHYILTASQYQATFSVLPHLGVKFDGCFSSGLGIRPNNRGRSSLGKRRTLPAALAREGGNIRGSSGDAVISPRLADTAW
jgi:hypothetical protein